MNSVVGFQTLAIRYTLSALAIVSSSVLLTIYASGQFGLIESAQPATATEREYNLEKNDNLARDYRLNPFDLTDAVESCQKKTRAQFGEKLLRTHPDWHSTRYDPSRRIYLVGLHVDVGSLQLFESGYVYCYVNPDDYRISYYRVNGLQSHSFFSMKKIKRLLGAQH